MLRLTRRSLTAVRCQLMEALRRAGRVELSCSKAALHNTESPLRG
jgi:hypothetical protein